MKAPDSKTNGTAIVDIGCNESLIATTIVALLIGSTAAMVATPEQELWRNGGGR